MSLNKNLESQPQIYPKYVSAYPVEAEIKLIESNWKADIKEKENKISELENQLKGNHTRIINQSELSLGPVGLSRNMAYILSVVLALFAAFFITLIVMFQAKVKEKLAAEI